MAWAWLLTGTDMRSSSSIDFQQSVLRLVAMPGMDQDGEHDGQQDTLLDADEDHHQGGDQCHPELNRALGIDLAHP